MEETLYAIKDGNWYYSAKFDDWVKSAGYATMSINKDFMSYVLTEQAKQGKVVKVTIKVEEEKASNWRDEACSKCLDKNACITSENNVGYPTCIAR